MQRIGKQTETGKINRTAHFKMLSQQKGQAGGHLLTRASTAIDSADRSGKRHIYFTFVKRETLQS